jgi:antitoxin (DNA-binding transcriptional repressor) of toxin-antitoxin stability system
MEKSYGIEAARAQLGDIADHARTTGETIALTRHGRAVAVIGPAASVKPAGGVEVTLFYPHDQRTCVLPALPRMGESFVDDVELGPNDNTEMRWSVTEVQWYRSDDGSTSVGVSLDPVDDHTRQIMKRQKAERIAAARAERSVDDGLDSLIRRLGPPPTDRSAEK